MTRLLGLSVALAGDDVWASGGFDAAVREGCTGEGVVALRVLLPRHEAVYITDRVMIQIVNINTRIVFNEWNKEYLFV
jgi:hypothetical protein